MEEERETKQCPYCKEEILADAVKCRYCLSHLGSSSYRESPIENFFPGSSSTFYRKASIGRRFLGWLVDWIIAAIAFIILVPSIGFARLFYSNIRMEGFIPGGPLPGTEMSFGPSITGLQVGGVMLLMVLGVLWYVLYWLLRDGFGQGQSVGKKAAGLMVVRVQDNVPCGFGESAIRNLVGMLLGHLPAVGFLIEPLVLLIQEKGRRVGDLAAGTQVIEVEEYHSGFRA